MQIIGFAQVAGVDQRSVKWIVAGVPTRGVTEGVAALRGGRPEGRPERSAATLFHSF